MNELYLVQMYSRQTVWFLYLLHVIPAIYLIINIPYIIAACGLVECLWWQQLQIQLWPLLAVIVPFLAVYLQQKGKIYAGYLMTISFAYYGFLLWQGFPSFMYLFFLIALVCAQGYLLFRTTYNLFLPKIPKKKQKKGTSPYKEIISMITIIVVALIVLRFVVYTPAPSSESDCVKIEDQAKADFCYISLASSLGNFDYCTKIINPSSSDECYSFSSSAENCGKIKTNRDAMIQCLNYQFLWQSATTDYCEAAANPGLCNFGLAVWKEDLSLCTKSDEPEVCKSIVHSHQNLCSPSISTYETLTGPITVEHDVGGVCSAWDPYESWSYDRPAKETVAIDPADCQKITWGQKSEERVFWSDIYKDQCFTASAIHHKNGETCNLISDERGKWVCRIVSATSADDCDIIPSNEKIFTGDHYSLVRDECFLILAQRTGDLNFCNLDSDDHESAGCINSIVRKYGAEPSQCAAIPEGSEILGFGNKRAACYSALAHFKNDSTLCALVPIGWMKADCMGSIGSIEDCESIPKEEKTEDGQNYVKDSCITAIINRDPNVEYCNRSASPESFNWCVDLTARITGNKEICSRINDEQGLREICIAGAEAAALNQ